MVKQGEYKILSINLKYLDSSLNIHLADIRAVVKIGHNWERHFSNNKILPVLLFPNNEPQFKLNGILI